MKTKFRDIIIISVVSLIALLGFFMFNKTLKTTTYDKALVKYNNKVVATVYFKEKKVVKEVEDEYPIIDEENNSIIVLGNPQGNDNIRYKVYITYDFQKRTMRVSKEESPKKYCSQEGEKSAGSITCLPNGVSITFENYGDEFDGVI